MSYRVGVDIGGTFTDFFAFNDSTLETHALKVPSRPDKPGAEVLEGVRQLEERFGIAPSEIAYFSHGTTVGVNTVIQRKGIRLCHFATEGFVDVLEVARLRTPDVYDLLSQRPAPLIPKERVFPIRGRLLSDGSEEQAVDRASVEAAIEDARAVDAEGIVVSLINAYRNPTHEQQVAGIVRELAPDLPVFCSTDVWSIIREYERTITAVIHGYVQPRVSHYLTSLQEALREAGVPAEPLITKSNGGVMSAELGKTACAQMIMSGTASGVIGASHIATLSGYRDAISFDVGGTSADVAFIADGRPQYGIGEMIGEFPIYIPTVSVTSIGAGGGSIAWIDDIGVLKVGPESAGADPGPACYGKGGTRPALTDAFAVLGYVGQTDLGYNAVQVDVEAARRAVGTLAERLERSVEDTAEAMIKIAVSGMYLEVSKLVSSYGVDPRDNALIAFGGAGPMTACFLAEELNIDTVVIPTTPGVLSAMGGLIADLKNDFVRTIYAPVHAEAIPAIQDGFAALKAEGERWLREEQYYDGPVTYLYSGDMRYQGQSFEIEAFFEPEAITAGDVGALEEAFHAAHEQIYTHADRDAPVQIINLRLVALGQSPKPTFEAQALNPGPAIPEGEIMVHAGGTGVAAALFRRENLRPGQTFSGPAVVSQSDTTLCLPAGFGASVDGYGHLILTRSKGEG
ncbi:MAG: hydantoinase/oxoprolinase family protein [Rhodospirillaceae bacterium]|nr:hydantoinase/oxoprolinase family protein [Rhodospirillaceae bacterium]